MTLLLETPPASPPTRKRRVASWLLLAGGLLLLLAGSREFFSSMWSQEEISKDWTPPPAQRTSSPAYRRGETIGKLAVPRLNAELFFVEGTGKRELRMGPGHLEGTPLPGEKDNCIIAGHRDTHFRFLKDIRPGDEIYLDTAQGQYRYQVKSTEIVKPSDTRALNPTNYGALKLITCYPFYYLGPAPKRFIVQAELASSIRTVAGSPDRPGTVGFEQRAQTR